MYKTNNKGPDRSLTLLYASVILFHLLLPFVVCLNASIQLIKSFPMLKLFNLLISLLHTQQSKKLSNKTFKSAKFNVILQLYIREHE